MFCESSLSALSRKFKMGSIGLPSKILVSTFGKTCHDGEVFTQNVFPSTSFGGIPSNFVFGVLVYRVRTCGQIFYIMSTFKNTGS